MGDFFRFIVEFFRSPRQLFVAGMIAFAMINELLAFRMIQEKSIGSPFIQFLLYSVGAIFAVIAAFALLYKSPSPPTIKPDPPNSQTL